MNNYQQIFLLCKQKQFYLMFTIFSRNLSDAKIHCSTFFLPSFQTPFFVSTKLLLKLFCKNADLMILKLL